MGVLYIYLLVYIKTSLSLNKFCCEFDSDCILPILNLFSSSCIICIMYDLALLLHYLHFVIPMLVLSSFWA